MRINNNYMAMKACGFMRRAAKKQSKSIEKLSTGLAINSAADDAAGLAVSEKMRSQINGLNRAASNTQDGISMLQTAEGALRETVELLQKMRVLALQSANDTLIQSEREMIQSEVNQLASEITIISNTTEFNGRKILNGTMDSEAINGSDMTLCIGPNGNQSISFGISAVDAHSLGVDERSSDVIVLKEEGDVTGASVIGLSEAVVDGNVISVTTRTVKEQPAMKVGDRPDPFVTGDIGNISLNDKTVYMKFVRKIKPGDAPYDPHAQGNGEVLAERFQIDIDNIVDLKGKIEVSWDTDHLVINTADSVTGFNAKIELVDSIPPGTLATLGFDETLVTGTDESYTVTFSDGIRTDSVVTIAADATSATGTGDFEGITIELDGTISNNSSTVILDITSGTTATIEDDGTVIDAFANEGIDVSTGSAAGAAINIIDEAIVLVSEERARVGALHNRLEHIINNLLTTSENLTDSESRIRDVDMAKEMMEYTRLAILMEVSQAMMAQANKNPEEVLSLLR
jgi:flagellin